MPSERGASLLPPLRPVVGLPAFASALLAQPGCAPRFGVAPFTGVAQAYGRVHFYYYCSPYSFAVWAPLCRPTG